MSVIDFIRESNHIEGIDREPTAQEAVEFGRFMLLDALTIEDVVDFVKVYQPGAVLRNRVGLNVRVGHYRPPSGGSEISDRLHDIIESANALRSPWKAHVQYEMLHPFTDGNGRSGRAIWYWMMRDHPMRELGFLHAFYYQTLANHSPESIP